MKAHFVMMSRYNTWANARAMDAAGGLSEADARADCGAFFTSVHGTLNHMIVADLIWMHRFTGEGEAPSRLDAIVHETHADLAAARSVLDATIEAYTASLDEAAIAGDLTYIRVTNGERVSQNRAEALAHFFNHQTHHRGQVHAMLTRLAGHAPSFDLLDYQRSAA